MRKNILQMYHAAEFIIEHCCYIEREIEESWKGEREIKRDVGKFITRLEKIRNNRSIKKMQVKLK